MRLSLEHRGFDLDSPLGKTAFQGMEAGWPKVLARIAPVLSACAGASLEGGKGRERTPTLQPTIPPIERSLASGELPSGRLFGSRLSQAPAVSMHAIVLMLSFWNGT